ncbi:MAG: winged-helix domain-containing protein [Actinomycetota bacterium]|nr:response regulator transcription factor [Actinomycetota bacterium]
MADILILSDRDADPFPDGAALEAAGHRVGFATLDDRLGTGPTPDICFVDSVKDLARGRDACRAMKAQSPRLPIIAAVATDALDAVGPDWQIDSFVVEGAPAEDVLARVRLLIGSHLADSSSTLRVGELAIDPDTYQIRLKGRPLDLTYKEFELLRYLAQRPGRVFSRSQLLQEVWGYDYFGGTRTVDVHVRRLRAKLGAEHESLIATVRNVGYKLEPPARRPL